MKAGQKRKNPTPAKSGQNAPSPAKRKKVEKAQVRHNICNEKNCIDTPKTPRYNRLFSTSITEEMNVRLSNRFL